MKVHLYERIWLWLAAGMIVLFLGAVLFAAGSHAVHPPSHLETIDPERVSTEGEFANHLGVRVEQDGVTVRVVAEMYVFRPASMTVPAGRPVTFRMTSPDVIHGFQIVGTNVNAMVVPGYISQMTTRFDTPGEYLVMCNEFCGISHHLMHAKVIVEEQP